MSRPERSRPDAGAALSLAPAPEGLTSSKGAASSKSAKSSKGKGVASKSQAKGKTSSAAKPEPKPEPEEAPERESAPSYLDMVRGELRIRPDQKIGLLQLRQRLMAARTVTGFRFTENTLIRVAIDALLARQDELSGNNEDELRDSVV